MKILKVFIIITLFCGIINILQIIKHSYILTRTLTPEEGMYIKSEDNIKDISRIKGLLIDILLSFCPFLNIIFCAGRLTVYPLYFVQTILKVKTMKVRGDGLEVMAIKDSNGMYYSGMNRWSDQIRKAEFYKNKKYATAIVEKCEDRDCKIVNVEICEKEG